VSPWLKWLAIAAAGACGTLARYGLSGVAQRAAGSSFPWGTFAVNCAGCLLIGVAAGWLEGRIGVPSEVRAPVLIGFLGAFTTFSTFAFESATLLIERQWGYALANLVGQCAVGVVLVLLGLVVGRAL